jgi:hypothetical protein
VSFDSLSVSPDGDTLHLQHSDTAKASETHTERSGSDSTQSKWSCNSTSWSASADLSDPYTWGDLNADADAMLATWDLGRDGDWASYCSDGYLVSLNERGPTWAALDETADAIDTSKPPRSDYGDGALIGTPDQPQWFSGYCGRDQDGEPLVSRFPSGAFVSLNTEGNQSGDRTFAIFPDCLLKAKWAEVKNQHPACDFFHVNDTTPKGDFVYVSTTERCVQGNLPSQGCAPPVMCISPNSETFDNAARYPIPAAALTGSALNAQASWGALCYATMPDPFSTASSRPKVEARCAPPVGAPPLPPGVVLGNTVGAGWQLWDYYYCPWNDAQ